MNNYPKNAQLNRFLPKSKIFEFAKPSAKVKDLFTQQINKITIAYSLSSRSINLPATSEVEEIQVIKIELKKGELNNEVLKCIDMAICSPLIFELSYNGKLKTITAFKRPSEADKNKWVISSYFETDWLSDSTEKSDLPVVLNMAALYHFFLKAIMPLPFRKGETMDELVQRFDQLRIKERKAKQIEKQINKEKQFNRRVELNRTLNSLKTEIENLKI